ncbi:plastocyanin/azurin family copper-binding protein [Conexibacter sp. SYSU D00693]|uniref:plastocyanin/azurin family copper-binding protein n=1 Tax=Conexibacter sp. SYSU D00693 TaxID=2812560 RepID=UPI00196A62BB|nr:plastocyanin/azurin family copper-binding protein [Conexibacter sp. SYSU D00693]
MTHLIPRRAVWLTALCLAVGGVAGCGDDDEGGSAAATTQEAAPAPAETAPAETAAGGGETQLEIDATEPGDPPFGFSKEELTAKPGQVTITMANPDGNKAPHAVALEGPGVDESGEVVPGGGGDSTVSAPLEAGTYTFYCPVGQHRQNGMEGTLTVE